QRRLYLEAWEAAGVTCIFQNSGEEGQSAERMLQRLSCFTQNGDLLRSHQVRAVLPDDIVEAKAAGKHCVYFTTNGVPLQQKWNSPEEELRNIGVFSRLGVRMMHLAYNRRNMLGDGCSETANAGLSDF